MEKILKLKSNKNNSNHNIIFYYLYFIGFLLIMNQIIRNNL